MGVTTGTAQVMSMGLQFEQLLQNRPQVEPIACENWEMPHIRDAARKPGLIHP